jgi:hypothetical protein
VDFNEKAGKDGKGDFTFDVRKGPSRERGHRARGKVATGV